MSTYDAQRRRLLLAGLVTGTASGSVAAAAASREAPAFWSRLVGTWSGELSYLDGALEPIIQSYHAVADIGLSDNRLSHTEFKIYPPGSELSRNAGGADLPADEGIEVITNLRGPIDQERWTPNANEVYQLVDEVTIVRHLRDPDTGVPRYVTLLITNLGILFTRYEADYYNRPLEPLRSNSRLGELKGCSVFRYTRLADGRGEIERQRLRELHNVTRSVDTRPTAG